jgi:hypothetical protein
MMNRYVMSILLSALALSAHAVVTEPAGISAALRPAPEEAPAFVLNAQGVQIYVCKAKGNSEPYDYAWAFVSPEATLSEDGAVVGRHFAGPTWESSSDRSSVTGAVRERQDGGAGNIPWLRAAATPAEGAGRFAGVTSVLRVKTRGGVEPKTGCGSYQVGQEERVPYTADYYFYKKK